jgi:hypothetical protein
MPAPLTRVVRVLAVLAGSWTAGALLCVMKGDTGGLLDDLGNLSAPYAIAAVIAGLNTRRWWSGAALGVAATEAMLTGFYWAYATLLGHEVSTHTLTFWWLLGLASGSVCGLLGRAAVGRPALWYLIPALLLFEPLALRAQIITSHFGYGYADIQAGELEADGIEIVLGIVVLLAVRTRVRAARRIKLAPTH